MNEIGQYLHKDQERYTNDYEQAYQFDDEREASYSLDLGNKIVGPCKEGDEP